MDWIFFAFLSALLAAAAAITQKKALFKEHAMEFSATLAIVVFVISLPLFIVADYSNLSLMPILLMYATSILGAIAFLLVAKAQRHMDVSSASPLLVAGPAFTAIIAFIILGEKISMMQVFGILLLIIGAYVLQLGRNHDLIEPFRIIRKSKYIHYIFLALVFYGLTATADRTVLGIYDIPSQTYIAFVHVFLAINFLIMMLLFHDGLKGIRSGIKRNGWWILLVAAFTVGYRLAEAEAIRTTQVALVSAIKRLSALFAVILGGELFHEKNLIRKSIACLIMIGGVVLVII